MSIEDGIRNFVEIILSIIFTKTTQVVECLAELV